ncbi:NUDIX domain-containing protein [Bacillus sp. TL12]|uniref:NUDIX domain-containing protein n=1 Tax=Bacillus sp. TL12 TaxID=2894756 RepID=UPI001F523A29|nr:NUDIX domain-containing protein [Bacillus sp. TL12]MCI0766778.1 NUDIX domain-containing protein [Bacillus sp. TL12]
MRNSVKAILIHESKLLVTTYEDQDGTYHLLPGGGQKIGETLDKTLKRECLEETEIEVKKGDLLFIRECFLDPEVHRVEFMYSCTPVSFTKALHMDSKQTGISWLPIDDLVHYPLFPSGIKKLIQDFHAGNESGPVYVGEID